MTTALKSSLMTFSRHGGNYIKLHCISSLSAFCCHFPRNCCVLNIIQQAHCEASRLSQRAQAPTHEVNGLNVLGNIFRFGGRRSCSHTFTSFLHKLNFPSQVIKAFPHTHCVLPQCERKRIWIVLCVHHIAHYFGLPASFHFHAFFSPAHTCSLSDSSLPVPFM